MILEVNITDLLMLYWFSIFMFHLELVLETASYMPDLFYCYRSLFLYIWDFMTLELHNRTLGHLDADELLSIFERGEDGAPV